MKNKQNGFTLVELSVILVIVALIVAALLGGSSLLQNTRLIQVYADLGKLKVEIAKFEIKYTGLPGDLSNAVDHWATTVNGNGNAQITGAESLRAWQQLSLSNIDKRDFAGTAQAAYIGETIPGTEIENIGFTIQYSTHYTVTGNNINISSLLASGPTMGYPAFSAIDANMIDRKIDDGKAGQGNIVTKLGTGASGCVDNLAGSADNIATTYVMTSELVLCQIYSWLE